MTGEDFRELALGLEGAVEQSHMRHPDFRVNGRIFATLTADEREGVVMLPPAEQQQLIGEHPAIFKPAAGAWGRQGYTVVHLAAANPQVVRGALQLAWQQISEKSTRPRRKPAPKRGAQRAGRRKA
jgi:hypothetical protein